MAEPIGVQQETVESPEVSKEELALATEVMQSMLKTSKAFKMYLPNNPLLVRFVDELVEKFGRHLSLYGDYRLDIDQFELKYKGKIVYENHDPKESLAFKMYSDGVRFFIFNSGLDENELCGFLEIVGKERPGDVDDDIVTLLWEKNYPHIDYILDEDFLEYDSAAGGATAAESQQGKISRIYSALSTAPPPQAAPSMVLAPQQVLTLTEEEIETLKQVREAEEKKRPLEEVLQIVSAILAGEKDLALFTEFLEIMARLIEGMANVGEIRLTLKMVRFLDKLAGNEEASSPKRPLIVKATQTVFSERNVPVFAAAIDKGTALEPQELLEMLQLFGRPLIPRMCELLALVENMKMRKVILQVLIECGREVPEQFIPYLSDRRWYLVRNIIFILGRIGSPMAMEQVTALSSHREPRVRKEVLAYLERFSDSKSRTAVMRFLRDDSSAIRIRALKLLGAGRSAFALKPLIAMASSEQFAEKELAEKTAVFEAIAEIGGDQVLPMFRDMLFKKFWFNKAKEKESVVCAVAGLARLRSPAAVKLLEEARDAKSEDLREIITQAIQAPTAENVRDTGGA
jgi:hypothetical protein